MKNLRSIALFLVILVSVAVCGCRTITSHPLFLDMHGMKLQQEQSYGDYVVSIYKNGDYGCFFEIVKNGCQVYAAEGYSFRIGSIYEEDKKNSLVKMGTDITGDGQPNLVVSEWTGGAHSSYLFHVFQIGSSFRYIQTIDAEDSDAVDFQNLDEDPALEFPMCDWTFAYWRTGFAQSPAPDVILKYQGQKYEMSCDLMRKPALPEDRLHALADEIKALPEWKDEHPPVRLWAEMLDLIYAGNMPQAWELTDIAWPQGIEGKVEFLADFKAKLEESPFWKDIQKQNKT